MSLELFLRYRRVEIGGGESAYSGELFARTDDGALPWEALDAFDKQHFRRLLTAVARHLRAKDYERVVLERIDRQGLQPFVLDNPMTELLRADPAAALQILAADNPPIRIDLRKKAPPPIVSGYDTVAETLGEHLYCSVQLGRMECPVCGRWSAATSPFCCADMCGLLPMAVIFTERWGKVAVSDLLDLHKVRYFIPRGFNTHRPWMSWEALHSLHMDWIRHRDQKEEVKS